MIAVTNASGRMSTMPRKRTAGPAFEAIEAETFRRHGLRPRTVRLELGEPRLSLRAVETGSGEPLLLLHGIGLTAAHWAPMMARLAWARCIALDMPGHGETDGADFRGVELRRWHTDLLRGCLDRLGLDSAHIVGHSYGGMFGMWLALDAPEPVRSVISIGAPSIALGAGPNLLFRASAGPALGPLMLRSPMPRFLLRLAYVATRRRGFQRRLLGARFDGLIAAVPIAPNDHGQIGGSAPAPRPGAHSAAASSACREAARADTSTRSWRIPEARLETVPGGHAPWLDDPEPCATLVSAVVDRRPNVAPTARVSPADGSGADEERIVRRFHELQRASDTGGPLEPLIDLLADDVCWHVPGNRPIAGDHRGRNAVLASFRRRRDLAEAAFRLQVCEIIAMRDLVFQRVDGTVSRAGTSRS
jgi:pimeloyl-ACP methyl ester carboxylesterase